MRIEVVLVTTFLGADRTLELWVNIAFKATVAHQMMFHRVVLEADWALELSRLLVTHCSVWHRCVMCTGPKWRSVVRMPLWNIKCWEERIKFSFKNWEGVFWNNNYLIDNIVYNRYCIIAIIHRLISFLLLHTQNYNK